MKLFCATGAGDALLLRFCLAWGFGSGILSIFFFVYLSMGGGGHREWLVPSMAVLIALLILIQTKRRRPGKPMLTYRLQFPSPVVVVVLLLLAATLVKLVMVSVVHPHGWGDAVSIWNLRARLLFESGTQWPAAFGEGMGGNPGYPLLNSAYTALVWELLGSAYVPVLSASSVLYYLALAGLFGSAICLLTDRHSACISTIVLFGIPMLSHNSATQYNDVRLAFFILAACVLSTIHLRYRIGNSRLLILTGFSLGMAAWTKNEGLFFCMTFVAGHLAYRRIGYGEIPWHDIRDISYGAAPVLMVLLWFKSMVPANRVTLELISGPVLDRIVDLDRHVEILAAIAENFMGFESLLYIILAAYLISCRQPLNRRIVWIVGCTWAGYYLVYLTTSTNLAWHLDTSLSRLTLQLLPALLFALFSVGPHNNPVNGNNVSNSRKMGSVTRE